MPDAPLTNGTDEMDQTPLAEDAPQAVDDAPEAEPVGTDDALERALHNVASFGEAEPDDAEEPEAPLPDVDAPDASDPEALGSDEPEEAPFAPSEPEPEPDGFDDEYEDAEIEELDEDDNPFNGAVDAARGAHQSLREGIAAFKSVREASQLHWSARDTLRQMKEQLEEDREALEHRIDIEQRYPQIIAEQTAERDEASALSSAALRRADELDLERESLEQRLATMKQEHEEQLRPYRNLAESSKGRADDKARALADAKRAAKEAEQSVAEATKRREQRTATANRAVDNAQERMRKVQAELDAMQQDPKASPAAVSRLQNEVVAEKAHIDSARAEVGTVTEEARQAVERAQQRLFDQRSLLEQAEREAEATKREATERRSEYDKLLKEAQDQERALSDQIKEHKAEAEQQRKASQEAEVRVAAAQYLLDEAEQIHATPQETIELRDRIARQQTDLDIQQDEVDALAESERSVRKGTFRQRLILVLAIVAVVTIIVAIVVALLTHK